VRSEHKFAVPNQTKDTYLITVKGLMQNLSSEPWDYGVPFNRHNLAAGTDLKALTSSGK
jgi:hypothetical protein